MISRLLGQPSLLNKQVVKRWPETTGIDILANQVYSICKGVVIFVGTSSKNRYAVSVQIDSKQVIRYCNLKSVDVKPNQIIDMDKIGTAEKYVRIEYCTKENTAYGCVRIGTSEYYKADPYPIFTGTQNLSIAANGVTSYDQATSGIKYDPKQLIRKEAISPYIATLSETASPNYRELRHLGVVGVMIYGGSLYDAVHLPKDTYRSNSLKQQVNDAVAANMYYGIYVDVRSRSVQEAKQECKELYYVISKYPPKLGIWLKLQLTQSNTTNNAIIEEYMKRIEKWGLKSKCGIYTDRNQLDKISWDKYCEFFNLWLIAPIGRIDPLNELLTPSLFKL